MCLHWHSLTEECLTVLWLLGYLDTWIPCRNHKFEYIFTSKIYKYVQHSAILVIASFPCFIITCAITKTTFCSEYDFEAGIHIMFSPLINNTRLTTSNNSNILSWLWVWSKIKLWLPVYVVCEYMWHMYTNNTTDISRELKSPPTQEWKI